MFIFSSLQKEKRKSKSFSNLFADLFTGPTDFVVVRVETFYLIEKIFFELYGNHFVHGVVWNRTKRFFLLLFNRNKFIFFTVTQHRTKKIRQTSTDFVFSLKSIEDFAKNFHRFQRLLARRLTAEKTHHTSFWTEKINIFHFFSRSFVFSIRFSNIKVHFSIKNWQFLITWQREFYLKHSDTRPAGFHQTAEMIEMQ